MGADLRGGSDIELGRRVGGDDRADVAAVEDGAAFLGGEGALEVHEPLAHARMHRHPAGQLAGGAGA